MDGIRDKVLFVRFVVMWVVFLVRLIFVSTSFFGVSVVIVGVLGWDF